MGWLTLRPRNNLSINYPILINDSNYQLLWSSLPRLSLNVQSVMRRHNRETVESNRVDRKTSRNSVKKQPLVSLFLPKNDDYQYHYEDYVQIPRKNTKGFSFPR